MNIMKKDTRALSEEAQAVIRKKAVEAVNGGMNHAEAARVFGVARGTVSKWMGWWREKGKEAFKPGRRGRPGGISLEPWQAAQTVRLVRENHPEQLRLPFVLWTREAVAGLIEERHGVKLSVWTVGRYLKRWGFTPQKPVRRAFERNPEAVRQWLEEEYHAIRALARREGAEIHWGDEMGLRSDCQVGRSYSVKGKTPVVPGTGRRFGCNMISTITNRGVLRFMVFEEKFNADVFIEFARRLLKAAGRKVYLIVDRHPVHKSGKVKRWFGERGKLISLFFLPPYSPELNPDEMLNNDVKSNAVGRRRPRDKDDMVKNLRGYLRSTQKMPEVVKNYFMAETVRYAAAS